MKTITRFLLLVGIAAITFGCQSESVKPTEGNNAAVQGSYLPVPRPTQQCGPSVFSRIKSGNLDLGGVEIMNSSTDLYLIFDLNQYKFLEEVKIYCGEGTSIPTDDDGNIQVENFPCQQSLSQPLNDYTVVLPLQSTPHCDDVVIWARITTRSLFGNVIATNYAWMSGSPLHNGFKVGYCAPACTTGANTNDNTN